MLTMPKVLVSGCFDPLHSGHVAFFEEASFYGDLYVAVGRDESILQLKDRDVFWPELERLFMVNSIKYVKEAFISVGTGMLDFSSDLLRLKPDFFIVNKDGHTNAKRRVCEEANVKYIVLERKPAIGLKARTSTEVRSYVEMPYRIDLAGGWLDQPFVSKHYSGSVITASIDSQYPFALRSGMASSTRNAALDLWGSKLPKGDEIKLSRILFSYENPPGKKEIAGSQDAIGIVLSGLACLNYEGEYWPNKIDRLLDEDTILFVEKLLKFVPLKMREEDYDVLAETNISSSAAKYLAEAARKCWDSIKRHDKKQFGLSITESFEAQLAMFPRMVNSIVTEAIENHGDQSYGWKLSGAGGGGYLVLVTEQKIKNAISVKIRRPGW